MDLFLPATILLPQVHDLERWSVIACDQFSAQPEYWRRVREKVADAPSTLHMILHEAELGQAGEEEKIAGIHAKMKEYLQEGLFAKYENCLIYVERTLMNGEIRKGIIGKIDLEQYEYMEGALAPIRCTEKTVVERIPPRMKVRWNAELELPHVLLLCDDKKKTLIEPIAAQKELLKQLYHFSLMEAGGELAGWLVEGSVLKEFEEALRRYQEERKSSVVFAVGDGNHSLATAKACYERLKKEHPKEDLSAHPARYAMVELENIHDKTQVFEPINRIVFDTEAMQLLEMLTIQCSAKEGYPIEWHVQGKKGTLYLDPSMGELAVGILQKFLDEYLNHHKGRLEYIHGDYELKLLADQRNAIGFILPAMEKKQLFKGIEKDGVLPRKTFSMGKAQEKRYYLECRQIQ